MLPPGGGSVKHALPVSGTSDLDHTLVQPYKCSVAVRDRRLEFGSCEISARIMLSSGKLGLLFVGEHKVLDIFFNYAQKLAEN